MKAIRSPYLKPLVIGWLVLTVASVVARVVVFGRMADAVDRVFEASFVSATSQKLFSTLQDAETSQRGFLLTGEEAYLEPYKKAQEELPKRFEEMTDQIRRDVKLANDLVEIRGNSEKKMLELSQSIETRRKEGYEAALTMVKTGEGRVLMDQLRELTSNLQSWHLDMAAAAAKLRAGEMRWAQTITNISGICAVGAGLLALALFRMNQTHEVREETLIEEKDLAQSADREKSTFLANMSHEIRTPMNAILGFSELLAPEMKTERQKNCVAAITTAGASLLRLINDILDISKVEAGMVTLNPEPINMSELCAFLHTVFNEQAARRGLKLETSVDETLPRALLLDRLRIRQVLINLIGNALKFTKLGGVMIRIQAAEGTSRGSTVDLVLEVIDTGVGIPQERQEAIFKPFVQGGVHKQVELAGTGLGLNIVQRLTTLMGGTLELESTEGVGSTFRVRLPAVPISARLPVAEETRDTSAVDFNDFTPNRFLVVDDNEVNRRLLLGIFEETHHQVRFAANGAEALEMIKEEIPDLVLMDLRMPVMDGREALRRLRETQGRELIPVVAVTASSLAADEASLREKFNGYLRKPFSRAELYHEIAQFIPRAPRPAAAEGAPAPEAAPEQAISDAMLLAETLRGLEREVWGKLRDSPGLMETKQFAVKLASIAEIHHSKLLATYADDLRKATETFSFSDIENALTAFPEMVAAHQPTPAA